MPDDFVDPRAPLLSRVREGDNLPVEALNKRRDDIGFYLFPVYIYVGCISILHIYTRASEYNKCPGVQ